MASSFTTKTSINGHFLRLSGTSEGGISISSKYSNGDLTVTLNSKKPLTADVTGDLDATIFGSKSDDNFNFSGATGDYVVNTREGNDRVIDGIGNNTFDGGAGSDTFVFNQIEGPNAANGVDAGDEIDTIKNYDVANDDIDIGVQTYILSQDNANQVTITLEDGDRIVVQAPSLTISQIQAELV